MRNALPELRAERGWSQGALGERVGVSRQAINAIERGKHDPSILLAFKLARAFRLPVEAVFDPELPEPERLEPEPSEAD